VARHPYRVSKAWHHGQKLAVDIHELATKLAGLGDAELAASLQRYANMVPAKIAASQQQVSKPERLLLYRQARGAVSQLQVHLLITRDRRHIDHKTHAKLSKQAVKVHKTLSKLIKKLYRQVDRLPTAENPVTQ